MTRKKGAGVEPKENPNPEKLARTEKSTFILKPRQCFGCLKIFTPGEEEQTHCPDCVNQPPEEDRLAECKRKDCKCVALTSNKSGLCKEHYEEKKTESREWYRNNQSTAARQGRKTETGKLRNGKVPNIPNPPAPPPPKKIAGQNGLEEFRGTPKSKLIKSLFFLFKEQIVNVSFHLASGETFSIRLEDPK